jgi:hypothetical protein
VTLLPWGPARAAFVLAGLAVEIGGLAMLFRAHRTAPGARR